MYTLYKYCISYFDTLLYAVMQNKGIVFSKHWFIFIYELLENM